MADKVKYLPLGVSDLVVGGMTFILQKQSDGTDLAVAGITFAECTKAGFKTGTYKVTIPEALVTETLYLHARVTLDDAIYMDCLVKQSDSDEAHQSTLLLRPVLADVIAAGGMGGLISAVIDAGVTIATAFNPVQMEKGEKKVLSYRITQGKTALGVDIPFDLSAYTGKFAVKAELYDAIAKIGPIDGVITAHADDTGTIKSVITFTIPTLTTKAMATFNGGRYSIAIYDIAGSKTVLTPAGGVEFNLMEDVLDVA